MVSAEVLLSPPISGSVEEVRFSAAGDCTWVRFTDAAGDPWCGIFGPGLTRARSVATGSGAECLVIASGQGYVVDVNSRRLLHKTGNDWLISAIAIPGRDLFVACTYTNLFAYSALGLVWSSHRVSFDGIEFVEASRSEVRGKVWDLSSWVDFTLAIDTWVYSSDFVCPFE